MKVVEANGRGYTGPPYLKYVQVVVRRAIALPLWGNDHVRSLGRVSSTEAAVNVAQQTEYASL